MALSLEGYQGVYITLNPLCSALLTCSEGYSAKDSDVLRRKWLLVDVDCKGKGKQSATDAEKQVCHRLILQIRADLRGRGWPAPILIDSGNGYHLLYRIDLPAADGGLVQGVLWGLKGIYDSPEVQVDETVYNPSRISKLPYTLTCKGQNTPDRPHRLSQVLEMPPELQIVPKELLEGIAGPINGSRPASSRVSRKKQVSSKQEPPDLGDYVPWYVPDDLLPKVLPKARWYMRECRSPAIDGKGGNGHTFNTVLILERGFALPWMVALPLLLEWNQTCKPPWYEPEAAFAQKWQSSLKKAREFSHRRGDRLDPGVRAEIMRRVQVEGVIPMVDLTAPPASPPANLFLGSYSTYSYWSNGTLAGAIAVV
jgi:hypothetical protein